MAAESEGGREPLGSWPAAGLGGVCAGEAAARVCPRRRRGSPCSSPSPAGTDSWAGGAAGWGAACWTA
ncbi:hypothetical protein, partial [Nonomuraea zeae]|uniref:hypothetical protein n=1 Tax=Nonomuraea zeae TaxID=1642303 RepID=UPI0019820C77